MNLQLHDNYCDLFSIHKYWPEFVCCEHCVALYKRTPHKYIRLGFSIARVLYLARQILHNPKLKILPEKKISLNV